MFDIYKFFSEIDGHIFGPIALRKGIEGLMARPYRGGVPPDFNPQDLFEWGLEEGIIIVGKYDHYMIKIPKEPLYAKF